MNRQQRRQGITSDYVNGIKSFVIKETVDAIYSSIALTLHDKYSWNQEAIEKFIMRIEDMFNSIDKGYLKLEDVKETVYQEIKLSIGGYKHDRK